MFSDFLNTNNNSVGCDEIESNSTGRRCEKKIWNCWIAMKKMKVLSLRNVLKPIQKKVDLMQKYADSENKKNVHN